MTQRHCSGFHSNGVLQALTDEGRRALIDAILSDIGVPESDAEGFPPARVCEAASATFRTRQPVCHIVAGANGSGKSTFAAKPELSEETRLVVQAMEEATWKAIEGYRATNNLAYNFTLGLRLSLRLRLRLRGISNLHNRKLNRKLNRSRYPLVCSRRSRAGCSSLSGTTARWST